MQIWKLALRAGAMILMVVMYGCHDSDSSPPAASESPPPAATELVWDEGNWDEVDWN